MSNTRQKICDAARSLFNEQGYNRVTIRMIATALNMSSGNLNYHFRKKEDILESLYFEMVEVFDSRVQQLDKQEISLGLMQAGIRSSMMRMIEYRFFWTDLYFLLKSNEKIGIHFEKVKTDRINGYELVFNSLIQKEILHISSFPREHQFLIEGMIDYSNTWLYASSLYKSTNSHIEIVDEASFRLLFKLYPYLTKMGKRHFKNLYPGFF
ncbi:MAG: TetR family transcriptional regulator [Bacteroidota bacterium]